ncbi:Probable peptide ABC transporter ATP-binding protein y4tR [Geodia barretti]|uniref:Probable peptide ABC transporter ATP-binding protein y4tR n=1 Tax=Geodia barretti TaxID=519541 RepID=A0AA35TBC5_GEOBA|nr:Probable peptide ABC transporter ATP-binding protein y4tR [Geodia barretti]
MAKLLEVYNLTTHFYTDNGVVEAVDGISYSVDEGEIVGIVGESGCGKSVSALSIMGLIPDPPGKIVEGEVIFDGQDLLKLSSAQMTQDSWQRHCDGSLYCDLELHLNMTASAASQRAAELLSLVGIPDAERRLKDYPHQMSGGMRQRVMIAMAVSCNPKLIIADEPTTALDMTIQAQILELMQGCRPNWGRR